MPETEYALVQDPSDDVACLMSALDRYDRTRGQAAAGESAGRRQELLRAACSTLVAGPVDLGVQAAAGSACAPFVAVLREARPDDLPEVRACLLWWRCAGGCAGHEVADALEALARVELWDPVKALVFRALAWFGRRERLVRLLPANGPLTTVEADAWLEASHSAAADEGWAGRIRPAVEGSLPSSVRTGWAQLLAVESALAEAGPSPEAERHLALLSTPAEGLSRGYAAAEARRLAVRAAAALVRMYLAQGRADLRPLSGDLGRLLPSWELSYLQGLAHWQMGDGEGASSALESALADNAHQTCVRVALAGVLASYSLGRALEVLDHPAPTRELLIARAALLARLRRFADAEAALACLEAVPPPGYEAARYRWARAHGQYRRHEQRLRAALAERRGSWALAERAWSAACPNERQRSLRLARAVFADHLQVRGLPSGQGWRRDVIGRRLDQGRREIGATLLTGDALFFRAAAAADPGVAHKDLQTLLRQRGWVAAEQQVGGARLVAAGDLLLRLGQAEEAAAAYERAGTAPAEVRERLATALVCAAADRSGPEALTHAVARAEELAPASPWPRLLGALDRLRACLVPAAREHLTAAQNRGAPEAGWRGLDALCAAADGGAPAEDLAVSGWPAEAEAVVRLVSATGPAAERVEAFVRTLGERWLALCPVDPAWAARVLLAWWCERGRWHEALKFADDLARSGQPWATELAVVVRVRHALEQAARGELDEAERLLREIDKRLPPGGGT